MRTINPVAAALFRFGWVFLTALLPLGHAAEIKVAWNANPAADKVADYRIWRGIDVVATSTGTSAVLDLPDAAAVLTLTARNAAGESEHSDPLELVCVTMEQSADLATWKPATAILMPKQASQFFRLKIETP